MKGLLKLFVFIFGFAFIFIGYSSILFTVSKLLADLISSDLSTIFYILLLPNFFFTMFTIIEMDKLRHKKKSAIIGVAIFFLLLNIRFFLFNLPYFL